VHFLPGLVVGVIVLGVVDVAKVEGQIPARLLVEVGQGEVGVETPVIQAGIDSVVNIVTTGWCNDKL
jgi:hypothetical protein